MNGIIQLILCLLTFVSGFMFGFVSGVFKGRKENKK